MIKFTIEKVGDYFIIVNFHEDKFIEGKKIFTDKESINEYLEDFINKM